MHEFALADAVIAAALDAARDADMDSIVAVHVRVGELQQIHKESFEFALAEVVPAGQPLLAATTIEVEIVPVRFACRPCGREFGLDDETFPRDPEHAEAIHFVPELAHAFLRCPACGSADFEVTAGRGVTIHSIEGA